MQFLLDTENCIIISIPSDILFHLNITPTFTITLDKVKGVVFKVHKQIVQFLLHLFRDLCFVSLILLFN